MESPRETRLRLVLAGLPEPGCNLVLGGPDGPVGRADLCHRRFGPIVENDGEQHLTDRRQWNRDIARLGAGAEAVDLSSELVVAKLPRSRRPAPD